MTNAITLSERQREKATASHTRIQKSLVARAEERILIWLARRIPRYINSDHLTLLGFTSQCLAGICYALSGTYPGMLVAGVVCLIFNWLGGTLARVRNRQRPRYGFYVDHITDTVGAFFLMGGLSVSGYVHPMIGFGMLMVFLMLSIEAYLATYTLGKFQLSYWIFGPTEIRMLLALGNLALLRNPFIRILGRQVLLFDFGGSIAIAGMSLMLVVSVFQHGRLLYQEEKIA